MKTQLLFFVLTLFFGQHLFSQTQTTPDLVLTQPDTAKQVVQKKWEDVIEI